MVDAGTHGLWAVEHECIVQLLTQKATKAHKYYQPVRYS